MIRGAATGRYPYPFLNPAHNSTASLVVTIVALFALGTVLIWLVSILTRRASAK